MPKTHITGLSLDPDIDREVLNLDIRIKNEESGDSLVITVLNGENEVLNQETSIRESIQLNIPNPRLWSPQHPFLYDLSINIKREGKIIDEIKSYFGMRKISLMEDDEGYKRIALNNKILFQYGVLDQGYWPDGLYTAPTDEALKYDIKMAKKLGFNMIRKHVKVEPARWYYHCDRLGMLVWQDMPNGGRLTLLSMALGAFRRDRKHVDKRKEPGKQDFKEELRDMINFLYNHPSIVVWVPFNEGWGQFNTKKVVEALHAQDPSRLIDPASGWHDMPVGDICDCHKYLGPALPENARDRAAVCGEFGGLGLKIEDHVWPKRFRFVYKKLKSEEQLLKKYAELVTKVKDLIPQGLAAAVYTQLTDVEGEINGLLTYDREKVKGDIEKFREINESTYLSS